MVRLMFLDKFYIITDWLKVSDYVYARIIVPKFLGRLTVNYARVNKYPKWLMRSINILGGRIEYKS